MTALARPALALAAQPAGVRQVSLAVGDCLPDGLDGVNRLLHYPAALLDELPAPCVFLAAGLLVVHGDSGLGRRALDLEALELPGGEARQVKVIRVQPRRWSVVTESDFHFELLQRDRSSAHSADLANPGAGPGAVGPSQWQQAIVDHAACSFSKQGFFETGRKVCHVAGSRVVRASVNARCHKARRPGASTGVPDGRRSQRLTLSPRAPVRHINPPLAVLRNHESGGRTGSRSRAECVLVFTAIAALPRLTHEAHRVDGTHHRISGRAIQLAQTVQAVGASQVYLTQKKLKDTTQDSASYRDNLHKVSRFNRQPSIRPSRGAVGGKPGTSEAGAV